MNSTTTPPISATNYNRSSCQVGVVHVGFGAFHRAHQAVYIDDYMEQSGDLRWGIAAVNLRGSEAEHFKTVESDITRHDGYYLKTFSPNGDVSLRRVRSHVDFIDWSVTKKKSEAIISRPSVHLVTITVTESGYYLDPDGNLNPEDPSIKAEISGESSQTIYAYLREALAQRMISTGAPLTIACCDNIRQNGKMLRSNLLAYLKACNETDLASWVEKNVAFPCSMVDRITPRSPDGLGAEFSDLVGSQVTSPIMAEDFVQWVLQSQAETEMPELDKVGVTITEDVNPYEETKIRVLNGGHTALTYLAALEGIETFDAAMRAPHLLEHFLAFENNEVLPALTLDLPFSKTDYLENITQRFGNPAIGDTVARICADGMAKFPIFVRPTIESCLKQGIMPTYAIRSIASWYVFALHVDSDKIGFDYLEPGWSDLKALLRTDDFITDRQLWGDLPETYPEFAEHLRQAITEMEAKWPV